MIKWQIEFFSLSKAAAFNWAAALINAANAAKAKSQLSHRDALLLKARCVPSTGQYLDTIRMTRLALLAE